MTTASPIFSHAFQVLGRGPAAQGDAVLHGAHGHPSADEFWAGYHLQVRLELAQGAGVGGGAHQPRGLALVQRACAWFDEVVRYLFFVSCFFILKDALAVSSRISSKIYICTRKLKLRVMLRVVHDLVKEICQ